jgi:hypothetical protein
METSFLTTCQLTRSAIATLALLLSILTAMASADNFFDGVNEPSRIVMDKARQEIERVRKGDFVVQFETADGRALQGTVEILHVCHEFLFGAPFSTSRAFLDLHNLGRMNPHWRNLQAGEDGPNGPYRWDHFDRMLKAAHEHGIAMRWHCLIYEQWGSPAWIDGKYTDKPWWNDVPETEEQWWELIEKHLRTVARHPHPVTGEPIGDLLEFDVINETGSKMWTNIHLEEAGKPATFPSAHNRHPRGNANAARMICLARKYLPKARLVVLEGWPIGDLESGSTKRIYRHFKRLFDQNSPVSNIRQVARDDRILVGTQGHFSAKDRSTITIDRINEGLERFAEFGKEIVITEYDPPTVMRDRKDLYQFRLTPEEQAAWSVNFHTLVFSKPYISEICRWAMSDRQGQKVDAGLLFADGRRKPEYHALKKLIHETWSTRWRGKLDPQGSAAFRGFFGTYEASLPGHAPVRFTLRSTGPRQAVCIAE